MERSKKRIEKHVVSSNMQAVVYAKEISATEHEDERKEKLFNKLVLLP